MTKDEIFKYATSTIDSAVSKPEREDDLYTPTTMVHPKGAVKVGFDTDKYVRALNACSINLRGLTFNLLPVLYALGMASKEYLVKYNGLCGDALRKAIKRDYIALGGIGGMFDVIADSDKYRGKFTFPTAPPREFWPYIELEPVGEDHEDDYPCPLRFNLRSEELAPNYEIWITDKQVEKRKEQEHIIKSLNKFFENGVTLALILEYFGHIKDKEIVACDLSNSTQPFKNVMK